MATDALSQKNKLGLELVISVPYDPDTDRDYQGLVLLQAQSAEM